MSRQATVHVFTDPLASPTGFPFKVMRVGETLSDAEVYESRERICDLGYLRHAYRRADGTVGYRCPAEPLDQYVAKGGHRDDAERRKCICNALFATIGLGQVREDRTPEPPIVTAGDDVSVVARFLPNGRDWYTAGDVLDYLLPSRQPI